MDSNDGLGDLHDELYAASEIAVNLLLAASRCLGDEYDSAAWRLANAADQIPTNKRREAPDVSIEQIYEELRKGNDITPSMAIQYAQHQIKRAIAIRFSAVAGTNQK